MYLNPEKLASGAYCCPQSTYVEGFFAISDELTAILVENKGFVIITVSGDVVTAVKPDTAALEAWEKSQEGIHQPCEPYGHCNGHGFVGTVCPECKTPQISNIPIAQVARIAAGSYEGKGSGSGISEIVLQFDFPPKFISIVTNGGIEATLHPHFGWGVYRGMGTTFNIEFPVTLGEDNSVRFPVNWSVGSSTTHMNELGQTYDYVAFG